MTLYFIAPTFVSSILNNGRSIFHKSYTIHRRHHCNIYTEVLHARADANTTADIDKIIADTHANTNGEHAATDIDTNAIANTSTIGVLMKRDIVCLHHYQTKINDNALKFDD